MSHIVESLLDIDFYKLTMGQFVFKRYPNVPVKYAFTNRTKEVRIADFVEEEILRKELDHARTLRFTEKEVQYLGTIKKYGERIFSNDFLSFLKDLELPNYFLEKREGTYILEFSGLWSKSIYWETVALSIINELYYRSLMKNLGAGEHKKIYAEGKNRLAKKIKIIHTRPKLNFVEFGTRRRFSRDWQRSVIETLVNEIPSQIVGTSNVWAAMAYGLEPVGTLAHEVYMIMSGIMSSSEKSIRLSQNILLEDWWEEYGEKLSIALTDTFGTDFFFRDMTEDQARKWRGLRQDSGDPVKFGNKAIVFYQRYGIDPRNKIIFFSDSLFVDLMVKIYDHFSCRIKTLYGWGTNLTNDLEFGQLSLVIKAVEANGHGLVKLSDNLAKASGNPQDRERFKRIFGYNVRYSEDCKY